jgi:hypothetical protein
MQIPVALVIGASEKLIGAVSDAAVSAQVLVAECSVQDATTMAAQMRPLVMVMPTEVYEFDQEGFDALARDVRSRVLAVSETEIDPAELEHQLTSLMVEAENQRPSWIGEL